MRDDHGWPEWDPDDSPSTERISRVGPEPAEFLSVPDELPDELPEDELAEEILAGGVGPAPRARPRAKRFLGYVLMVTGGVMALGVVLYTIDLIATAGDVPRGVVVADVDVGGMSHADAEAKLRRELEPRLTQPVPVIAGDVRTTFDPARSGLGLDWPSTLAQAGHQPLDPLARIESFFVKRHVDVVTKTDQSALVRAVSQLATDRLDHPPTEGSIGFRLIPGSDGGVTPYAIEPRDGQTVDDVEGAANLIKARWLDRSGVRLSVHSTPVMATSDGVHEALDQIVVPAVAKPVAVHGAGADALLKPVAVAAAMRFKPRPNGSLDVSLDPAKLQDALSPQLAVTEAEGKDAQVLFTGGGVTVQPSQDARKIDWQATFTPLIAVLSKSEGRDLTVRYQTTPPQLTTQALQGLGIKEVVAEFTTDGLSGAAVGNVRTLADKVNGAILKPGETFSLKDRAGPLSRAQGFAPAPVNEDGAGPEVVGGGISQLASTLYNAAYLAGLEDSGHTEHSYYLDRYPPGRDAIAQQDDGSPVDLRLTDNLTGGVAIQAFTAGSTVTVRIWGTKQYNVDVSTSGPRDYVAPTVEQQSGPNCQPSAGEPGFSITDTRVWYDLASGAEVANDIRVVRYAPRPTVICTSTG